MRVRVLAPSNAGPKRSVAPARNSITDGVALISVCADDERCDDEEEGFHDDCIVLYWRLLIDCGLCFWVRS